MNKDDRLHALDAVRGFALLLGVAFHAGISFIPGIPPGLWAIADNSPSVVLTDVGFVTHIFRMSLFFFIAGFFARMLYQRSGGARGFWKNRVKRILAPFIVGWIVVFPAIAVVWYFGMKKTFAGSTPPAPPPLPDVAGAFPLTHLWFLYYLLLIYIAVLLVHAVIVAVDRNGKFRSFVEVLARRMLRGYAANFVLGVPLAVCLLSLPTWFFWQGIPTPDLSLVPQGPAFVGYGTAVGFGWLVHRVNGALQEIQQRWLGHLLLAVAGTAVCLWLHHSSAPNTVAQVLVFCISLWSWVFAITGVALRFFSGYSAARRYVADASYWIYIAHLPVVAALQVWVGRWPLHWSVKYPLILALSFALLLTSYHVLVRPTFIGEWLNGRRYPLALTLQPRGT